MKSSFGNYFTADEFAFARAYAVNIGHGAPVYGGLTQGVAGLIFFLWYRAIGFSVADARTLSALIGFGGVVATYCYVRKAFDAQAAMLAALILRLSSIWIIFSTVALEVSFAFLCIPLIALVLSRKRMTFWEDLLCGATICLSVFTYPGVPLVLVSLVAAFLLVSRRDACKWFWSNKRLFSIVLTLIGIAFFFHIFHFAPRNGAEAEFAFLHGGGAVSLALADLAESLRTNLADLFLGGTSWYLGFIPHDAFLNWSLWPVFLAGAWILGRSSEKKHRAMVLSVVIAFYLNILITGAPGMRRLAGIVPIIALIVAVGARAIPDKVRPILLTAILALLTYNAVILAPKSLLPVRANPEIIAVPFPDAEMRRDLKEGNVLINGEEITNWATRRAILGQAQLFRDSETGYIGKVFFDRELAPVNECLTLLTWRAVGESMRPVLGPFKAVSLPLPEMPPYFRVKLLRSSYQSANCDR